MAISKKVAERISSGLRRFQPILAEARDRDISESDTVIIVAEMLADVLGYRRFVEITTEFAIRGTYVDLAVKIGQEVRFLIEAKAISIDLKDGHVKQAIDYGANHGIEWVILTNGIVWRVYKILFAKPIEKTLVFELNVLQASPRAQDTIECLGNLSREGFTPSSMTEFLQQRQATGRFSVAAALMSESVLTATRRELRRMYPGVLVDNETLKDVVQNEVLKREVVDSEEAQNVQESLKKNTQAALRKASRAARKAKHKEITKTTESPKPEDPQGVTSN